jgi:hypothetical protein
VITLDDLATIAEQLQPLVTTASPTNAQTTHHIETIFRRYGKTSIDAPHIDGEQPCR